MQGPHLSAKPSHFCKLDATTSEKAFYKFYNFKELCVKYKIVYMTSPNISIYSTWYVLQTYYLTSYDN